MKRTVVLGATDNPARYVHKAALQLTSGGYEMIPVGIKRGSVAGREILDLRKKPDIRDIHTITLYVGPKNQAEWIDYILSLAPERIIFNPGTANPLLMEKARAKGIEVVPGCTLVMLSIGNY